MHNTSGGAYGPAGPATPAAPRASQSGPPEPGATMAAPQAWPGPALCYSLARATVPKFQISSGNFLKLRTGRALRWQSGAATQVAGPKAPERRRAGWQGWQQAGTPRALRGTASHHLANFSISQTLRAAARRAGRRRDEGEVWKEVRQENNTKRVSGGGA